MVHPMPRRSENIVITEIAPCGLICSRCESFLAEKCSGCYTENSKRRKKCPVLDGKPFEESMILIACMKEKGVEQCTECEEFKTCEFYEAVLLKCPFKGPVYDLKPGYGYLIKEKKPDLSFRIFGDFIRHGANGLCISRQHPDKVKGRLRHGEAEIHWLTGVEGEKNIDPTNLGILSDVVIRFIEKHDNAVVILEGVELLITNNDFPKALRLVNHITEQVMQHNARFIVSIDERTLDKKEMALLERDMEVVGG